MWSKKIKTNCQLMAHCLFTKSDKKASFEDYRKYYEKKK